MFTKLAEKSKDNLQTVFVGGTIVIMGAAFIYNTITNNNENE